MLYGKVFLSGEMELRTGLHVGASKETMKIGGVDSPVVRDPISDFPYIPGSSLKGKMRSLLERALNKNLVTVKESPEIRIHVCGNEDCEVCRLFGSSVKEEEERVQKNIPSRVIVRDLYLTEESKEELEGIDTGLKYTEWKFENVIDRITASANPRQIERVPAGSRFKFEIIYNIENYAHVEEDLRNITRCMELLRDDYLGGQGSRGYGKVEFKDLSVTVKKIEYYLDGAEAAKKEFKDIEEAIRFIHGDAGN